MDDRSNKYVSLRHWSFSVVILVGSVLSFVATLAEGKTETEPRNTIISKSDPALAATIYRPAKLHEVKTHRRLAFYDLKVIPFATRTFDGTQTAAGIQLVMATSTQEWSYAPVLIVADGKMLTQSAPLYWTARSTLNSSLGTTIEDTELLKRLALAKEVYLTVLFSLQPPPFDRVSFKLSEEQLADCRLLADKFDELVGGKEQ